MQSQFELAFKKLGDGILLLEWPKEISQPILYEIIALQKALEKNPVKGLTETFSAYQSLALCFDEEITTASILQEEIKNLSLAPTDFKRSRWTIPVSYDPEKAPDLEAFAKAKNLTVDKVILLHSSPTYTIHFIGFLPGFMYLGGLDKKLDHPRKSIPARSVPKGSVAIGGSQTGIYPIDSPGGWHVIGSTPVDFFNPDMNPPCFAQPGDEIVFEAIDRTAYSLIELEVSNGTFTYKKEKLNG